MRSDSGWPRGFDDDEVLIFEDATIIGLRRGICVITAQKQRCRGDCPSKKFVRIFAMTTTNRILVPANTVVHTRGDGPLVELGDAGNRAFLVILSITKIIEQESLDVSIYGSADGTAWGAKSIAGFPQKFYCEESPLLLDLREHPDVKFVRAHWEVARWGRGTETPLFEFGVTMKEVPAEILREATAEAKALA